MTLGEGEVRAGHRRVPINEVELELKRGDASHLFELARELGRYVTAELALKSKSQRGYDLLDDELIEAVQADKIKLQRSMSPLKAFVVIGCSVLQHIAANESAARRSNPEGVHQMRVGLRRC